MTYRVVLADDEDLIREGMARQIESMGPDLRVVGAAADGVEALALVEKYVPEIVLMDINMPFLDGLECIRKIREKDPDCVIIIVSGYDSFDYARKALQYDVDYYLLKPVEDGEFEAAVRNAIRKHQERKTRAAPEGFPLPRENRPERIVSYIKGHYAEEDISIERLESLFGVSRSALFKGVKEITGLGTIDFIISLRIEHAKTLLMDRRGYSVKEICAAVGYGDQHYFSRLFKKSTGYSPRLFREAHAEKGTRPIQ